MAFRKTKYARLPRAWLAALLVCGCLSMPKAIDAADVDIHDTSSIEIPVYLYFADPDRPYLTAEDRPPATGEDPAAFCRSLLTALIQGPAGGLARTLPPDTTVRAVFIHDKIAYVDFGPEIRSSHPGGIVTELLTVYSVVNTVVLNLDGVEQVKFLIEERDAETLAGHIDIRFPLAADMMIIR